jgi:subfamily B ATP-binding cassette protein MsbA
VSVFKRLLPYVRPYWSWLVAGGLLAIVVSGADGLIAWLVKPAMDEIFIRRDVTMLKLLPLLILAVYVVKGVGRYGQSYMMASVGERVITALRRDLYAHIQAMPLAFVQGRHSADLMSRNLDRRVEVLAPVEDAALQARLDGILAVNFDERAHAWQLEASGRWQRVPETSGFSTHARFQELARAQG